MVPLPLRGGPTIESFLMARVGRHEIAEDLLQDVDRFLITKPKLLEETLPLDGFRRTTIKTEIERIVGEEKRRTRQQIERRKE